MAPSSASTIANAPLGPVTLPLFKLSHCTISSPGQRMLWTHLPNRDDIFAVFDESRSRDLGGTVITKQVLKLVRGGELFETIDFDSLKHQARLDRQRAETQSIPDELLYVVVVTKKPLLALRYRLPDGQIRRLQMNFQPPSGCDTALDILKPLGLPVRVKAETDPSQPVVQRPYSAQSVITTSPSRSQESRGILMGPSDDVSPSAQPGHLRSKPNRAQHGNNPDTFRSISYFQDPRVHAQRPSSGNGTIYEYNPLSRPSFVTDPTRMLPPAYRSLLPSPSFASQSSHVGGYDNRPISAPEPQRLGFVTDSMPISQMLPPVRELPFAKEPPLRDSLTTAAPSQEKVPTQLTASKEKPPPKRKRAPAKSKSSVSASLPKHPPPRSRTEKAKAAEEASDKVPPSSAPPQSQMAAPKSSGEAPPSSAPPKMGSTLAALEQTVSRMSNKLTPPSSRSGIEACRKRPLSALGDSETNMRQAKVPSREPSPLVERKPSQLEEHIVEPPPPDQQPTVPARPPNPVLSPINPAEFLDSLDGWIRKYHDLPAPKAPTPAPVPTAMTAKDQLAEYASKNDAERAKVIDEMICECLQDENFGKLADDLEGCWKRICLGF